MRTTDVTTARLWKIIEPVCTGSGYELVELVLTQSPAGWVLRVFIDTPPPESDPEATVGSDIGFDDCERVSRELSAVLDVEDPIDRAYNLEVSSPGLDRPLRKAIHFQRCLGQVAKISMLRGVDGRRNFKGQLVALEPPASGPADADTEDTIITVDVDGVEYQLPLSDVDNARLVPDWDSLFQRGQKR